VGRLGQDADVQWVGLIRNVMIGREGLHREVLLALLTAAGATDPRSHLATGNVTFAAEPADIERVHRALETGLAEVIQRREPVVLRSREELAGLVARDPAGALDLAAWSVEASFLPHDAPPVPADRFDRLGDTVLLEVAERHVVAARPAGGRSPHVNRILERASGARATSRGWSTLVRLSR
jgi:uncharacterized protein (DUF1697 family)